MRFKRGEFNPYKIVKNATVADPRLGEGRMIPVLILSSKNDSELRELLEIHKDVSSGDIKVQWGDYITTLLKKEKMFLEIEFINPKKFVFHIVFDIDKDYSLIDAIFQSRGVYINLGTKDDKISSVFFKENNETIVLEVADTNLDDFWEKRLRKVLLKKARKEKIPSAERQKKVDNHIKKMRDFFNIRRNK